MIDAFWESPIDMFAHPTNRLHTGREPLDLECESVKEYRETVRDVVSTDAHTTGELDTMNLGISQARRGWCEVDAVLNTRPLEELRSYFDG
ncbi:hypothetical protein [Natrinema sp. CBA1119]|uniref:hypothetical protein n=1 Tax=Natrinema sp. CBA1119 TaxID=1608465 RepID=UPI001145C815|nr:hypothetical protein [Natrinema sp. CBA1119]